MRAGKVAKQWLATRKEWVRLNPPNHQGYYICWICRKWVLATEFELDHIIPRSRAPHLRYVLSNLAPSCARCNREKGSGVVERKSFDIEDDIWY